MAPSDRDSPKRQRSHAYFLAPRLLPAFPDAMRVRRKGGRMRWKDRRGLLYEWDSRRGALEVYDALGRHLGEFDPMTGSRLKFAVAGRRVAGRRIVP